MESPPHGPEPCASANSAISALACFSPFSARRERPGAVERSKFTFVTEVTGSEPYASANSAISALAVRLKRAGSLYSFCHTLVKHCLIRGRPSGERRRIFYSNFHLSFSLIVTLILSVRLNAPVRGFLMYALSAVNVPSTEPRIT